MKTVDVVSRHVRLTSPSSTKTTDICSISYLLLPIYSQPFLCASACVYVCFLLLPLSRTTRRGRSMEIGYKYTLELWESTRRVSITPREPSSIFHFWLSYFSNDTPRYIKRLFLFLFFYWRLGWRLYNVLLYREEGNRGENQECGTPLPLNDVETRTTRTRDN